MLSNLWTWEECGIKCQENAKCLSWSWNVPDNRCSATGCKECLLYHKSATISDTILNKDWISGKKSCISSVGSCNQSGAGIQQHGFLEFAEMNLTKAVYENYSNIY